MGRSTTAFAQVWADNASIQQSLSEVTGRVVALSTKCLELQQRVANVKNMGSATDKGVEVHDGYLALVQTKIEDFENCQRRNNLRIFGIREGRERDDPRQFIVQVFGKAFPECQT
ncbi:hypothetical protein NDU88_006282 [Pleurodeles waltl]|uniref:Uncharacterized protein n=1 Tax=Pleurodeles waltl TaxID=8319 RepID=A0AAV7UL64_PLEWA|nr:hypothetical protein NDU88_006282 [Pleurodeles waltl]